MKLIIGLGNPGVKYEKTRHNLGFMVVDQFLNDAKSAQDTGWTTSSKLKSETSHFIWTNKENQTDQVIVAKPKTYMNNSGLAVSLLASYYKIPSHDIWIIYDELDLPFGSLKIRFGGAAAGHRGVESIMQMLDTDKFWRFRLGIGESHQDLTVDPDEPRRRPLPKQMQGDMSRYVLSKFTGSTWGRARELIKHGTKALETALNFDLETTMNKFNTK